MTPMDLLRKTLCAVALIALAGCTTTVAVLHDDQGHVIDCTKSYYRGLISSAIATHQIDQCVHNATAQGYHT
jgi:hypothetical protein